jgi:hypothetical protein
MPELSTESIESLQKFKGIDFPGDIRFRQILVTGPPGAGKSTLIRRLGGWSEEGYLDLAQKHWWRSEILSVRPREIHLGIPFCGSGPTRYRFLMPSFSTAIRCRRLRSTASSCRLASAISFRSTGTAVTYSSFCCRPPSWFFSAGRRGPGIAPTRWTNNSAWRSASHSSTCFAVLPSTCTNHGFYVYLREGMETQPLRFVDLRSLP